MKEILMIKGANTVVNVCAGIKEGEKVLIITEPKMIKIAKVITTAVYLAKAEPVLSVMIPRTSDGEEPPEIVANSMKESDVFISVVDKSITHTDAVKNAVKAGSRGIMLTQFNEDMLISGGLEADFVEAKGICTKIAKILENGKEIHLTTSIGTDLKFSAKGRRGNAMYCMAEPGEFCPVPTVEANVSPLENTAEGIIVADASIPYIGIGLLDEPVKCNVKNGKIVSITGGKQAKILKADLESKNDSNVYNIAEMGMGLNPKCKFTGFMLEDEGVFGTVHIGIGTSITLGGIVKAACHYDLIMTKPTVTVDGNIILLNGEVNI